MPWRLREASPVELTVSRCCLSSGKERLWWIMPWNNTMKRIEFMANDMQQNRTLSIVAAKQTKMGMITLEIGSSPAKGRI